MTKISEEWLAFARSMEAQYELIKTAFNTGDEEAFEQAILKVESARNMLKKGILDMIQDD